MALNDAERSLIQQFMQGDQEVRTRIVDQFHDADRNGCMEAERILVACMRQGDWTAWSTLLKRFENGLMSVAWQRLGRRQPAQDIVFDAFYEMAMTDKEIKSVRGWLRTYVDRRAVSAYRRTWREVWAADPHELVSGAQNSPAESAEDELAARRTWEDVKRLLTPQEQLLITRLADGARARDEAARLGMSLHAYEKRRQRACQRARAVLRVLRMWPQERRCEELDHIFTVAEKQAATKREWLTQSVVDRVTGHLEKEGQDKCRHCEREEKQQAPLRLPYEGLVIFAPSPELRDRMQQVCAEVRLGNQKKAQQREITHAGRAGDARRTTARVHTPTPSKGAFASGPRAVPRRRPARRVAKAAGAALLASLITVAITDRSGAGISLPSLRALPGAGAFTGPGDDEQAGGDENGGNKNGTANEGSVNARDKGNDSDQGRDGSAGGEGGGRDDGDGTDDGDDNGGGHGDNGHGDSGDQGEGEGDGGDGDGGDEGGGDGEIRVEEGEVVVPEEDTTGPSVSLAGISTSAVGQEVVDHHGSLMQTCGPGGTPTTYSVWVAASDSSGIFRLTLYIEHPTDGTYESGAGVTDGDAVRFDVPAYRTGPKALETVQLRLSVLAKDMNGNRTDADLGTLPLYECGEPG